jgi:hypothetical protein
MQKQKMLFLVKALATCPKCETKLDAIIGKDKKLWHECNKGNRETKVPSLKELIRRTNP